MSTIAVDRKEKDEFRNCSLVIFRYWAKTSTVSRMQERLCEVDGKSWIGFARTNIKKAVSLVELMPHSSYDAFRPM